MSRQWEPEPCEHCGLPVRLLPNGGGPDAPLCWWQLMGETTSLTLTFGDGTSQPIRSSTGWIQHTPERCRAVRAARSESRQDANGPTLG